MRKLITDNTYDEERALYGLNNATVQNCTFAGVRDGESVLKECRKVDVINCGFSLRYPLWHARWFTLAGSAMDDNTRAPIWYAARGEITDTKINGIKTLRECRDITVRRCKIKSPEFGWKCKNVTIEDSEIESEYFLFESKNVKINRLKMKGKYSFQYIRGMEIDNSNLDTKDAFWHSVNVTVKNSVVKGEYLGWFSDGLTLINCDIIGTQPLCYCKNLRLENCTMVGCDLAFEYSDVIADVHGSIDSVKNPRSGEITADSIGEVIHDATVFDCKARVISRS